MRKGLYIHWPFCQAKCPYCDFNSHVVARIDQEIWRDAYLREIDRAAGMAPDGEIGSVFLGGGTPSLMAAETVGAVIERIQRRWTIANDVEITLEANPSSVEAERFRDYRLAGVNRVSVGIQALNDTDLRRLGRLHSVAEARAALVTAHGEFDRVSFDLIYGRQDQTPAAWERELSEALDLATDHLALYQLTVEDGTAFGDRLARGGLRGLPDEDRAADLYQMTQEMTAAVGLPAYEISNHAAPGAESRHNMIYWTGGDYLGIGPGAHGRLTLDDGRIATEALSEPLHWLRAVQRGTGIETVTPLTASDNGAERLMMGLRVRDGVDLASIDYSTKNISDLQEMGLVTLNDSRLRLTEAGRPLLNAILRELMV